MKQEEIETLARVTVEAFHRAQELAMRDRWAVSDIGVHPVRYRGVLAADLCRRWGELIEVTDTLPCLPGRVRCVSLFTGRGPLRLHEIRELPFTDMAAFRIPPGERERGVWITATVPEWKPDKEIEYVPLGRGLPR